MNRSLLATDNLIGNWLAIVGGGVVLVLAVPSTVTVGYPYGYPYGSTYRLVPPAPETLHAYKRGSIGNIPSCVAILCCQGPTIQRLNPSQSKATTDGGSSRNTTTTVCELAKFRRNHISTKKALRSICSRKPLQNVHRCRSNERL
jgi:hypothetical protein